MDEVICWSRANLPVSWPWPQFLALRCCLVRSLDVQAPPLMPSMRTATESMN